MLLKYRSYFIKKSDLFQKIEYFLSWHIKSSFIFFTLKYFVRWMDGYFVYRRSTLKGHIASNKFCYMMILFNEKFKNI